MRGIADLHQNSVVLNLGADDVPSVDQERIRHAAEELVSRAEAGVEEPEARGCQPLAVGAAPPHAQGAEQPSSGPLYKCAICGALVYESQLDHHVLICPDPEAIAPPMGAVAIAAAAAVEAHTRVLPPSIPEESMEDAATSETTSPRSPAPEPRSAMQVAEKEALSRVAPQLSARSMRTELRRTQLLEERRRKEEEECTFHPKTSAKGTARSSFVRDPANPAEGRWSYKMDQRLRAQRLKIVEAQVYADVTHRPKITRFAQVWSQQRQEASNGVGQAASVFERLYSAAVQSRIQAEAQRASEAAMAEMARDSANISTMSSRTSQVARRIPTAELLYSDALDRRDRLRSLAERQQQELQKQKCQVLSRSRRLYWQMLERQVQVAFEGAAKGQPCLSKASLEDFLVRFGCSRPRVEDVASDAPSLASQHRSAEVVSEERARLCEALWLHLDPARSGSVDLVTTTVFFHVLMGAVDEQAREDALDLAPPSQEDRVAGVAATETLNSAAATSGVEESRLVVAQINGSSREAADEVRLEPTEAELSPRENPGKGPQLNDDNRHLVELLVRFDPVRLRSEFKTLYAQRLYYLRSQQQPKLAPCVESVTAPEIDERSRALASKRVERERSEIGTKDAKYEDIVFHRLQQTEARKAEIREKARQEEDAKCTFAPKMCTPVMSERNGTVVDPIKQKGLARAHVLYERAVASQEKKSNLVKERQKAQEIAQVAMCTFKPDTGKSVRSYKSTQESEAPAPRGFYESRQRLRIAGEANRLKHEQRENRMGELRAPVLLGAAGLPDEAHRGAPRGDRLSSARRGNVWSTDPKGCCAHVQASRSQSPISSRAIGSTFAPPRRGNADVAAPLSARGPCRTPQRQAPRASSVHSAHGRGDGRAEAQEVLSTPLDSRPNVGYPSPDLGYFSVDDLGLIHSEEPSRSVGKGNTEVPWGTTTYAEDDMEAILQDRSKEEAEARPQPLLYVDVNIAPGQPLERIELHAGERAEDVAAKFSARHQLTPALTQRLRALLEEVVQRHGPNRSSSTLEP